MPQPTIIRPTIQTYYVTFPFGARHMIGVDMLNMSSRWVEVRAMSREEALSTVSERFGNTGWQLYSEDQFTQDRREFYPDGACLAMHQIGD